MFTNASQVQPIALVARFPAAYGLATAGKMRTRVGNVSWRIGHVDRCFARVDERGERKAPGAELMTNVSILTHLQYYIYATKLRQREVKFSVWAVHKYRCSVGCTQSERSFVKLLP